MTERISLVEAYDNRDVIAQLVRLRDNVDELLNILKDIDPNGDLTNVVTKTGDQTIDGVKTFIGQIVADCDIIQNGAAYETHAEQVFSVNDYIVTRDGQITGLAAGDLSGFHVKKYNGVDDSRLGVDNSGTMRVGDVGSEEPLMTRDESGDMTSGNLLAWDGVNLKAITSGESASSLNTKINAKVSGSGNIGSDTYPVKIVNGEAVATTRPVLKITSGHTANITIGPGTGVSHNQAITGFTGTPVVTIIPDGLPGGVAGMVWALTSVSASAFQISLYNTGASSVTMSFYYGVIGV